MRRRQSIPHLDQLLPDLLQGTLLLGGDPAHQTVPLPRLRHELQHQEEQHVDAHEAPRAPCALAPDPVAPDLLLVIPPQDARVERLREARLVGLGLRQRGRRLRHPAVQLVVQAVQRGEALQVRRRPGVLARQQGRHLALRRRALRVDGLVRLPRGAQRRLRRRQVRLDPRVGGLDRVDGRVARQVVERLRGDQHARLQVVHERAEALRERGAARVGVGGQLRGAVVRAGRGVGLCRRRRGWRWLLIRAWG